MLFVKTRKRVFLALLVTMIVISSFYGSVPAVHSSMHVETVTDLFKYVKEIKFRIYTSSNESATIDFGYEIIDEENIDGQQTWKIEMFSTIVEYGNESRATLWISKDTGEPIQVEAGGEILDASYAGYMSSWGLGMLEAYAVNMWSSMDAYEVTPFGVDYIVTDMGTESVRYGPTTLSVSKKNFTSSPQVPEENRTSGEYWVAQTEFGEMMPYYKFEMPFHDKYLCELISIEFHGEHVTPDVTVGTPEFTLSNLEIEPSSAEVGDNVSISVKVDNVGDESGSYVLTLKIDGNVEDEKTVTLGPDESRTVSFDYKTSDDGTCSVAVNDLSGTFTVTTPSTQETETSARASLEEWSRTFGGSGDDFGGPVRETSDGGYIIAGYTYSLGAGEADVYLVKTDSQGWEEWNMTFGGSEDDDGYSVQETSDGGYIIAGSTESFGAGGWDVYLVKTDSQGRERADEAIYAAQLVQTESPSMVYTGETLEVVLNVEYEFSEPTVIGPGIFDLEADEWIAEEDEVLTGIGTRSYTFIISAPSMEKTWDLEARVWYQVDEERLHDETGWNVFFSIDVIEPESEDGGGIPGFMYESVILGLLVSVVFMSLRNPKGNTRRPWFI